MRKAELLEELDPVAAAARDARRRPLADAVEGEDRRLLEGRGEEGAGRVGLVVLGEDVAALVVAAEAAVELARRVELLLQPERQPHQEQLEAARRVGEVGLEQAVELQERLVVEGDVVEVTRRDAGFVEAVAHRVRGKVVVVLLAGEALLLRGRDDRPVAHQAGRAVVIEG